jgi:hypothetical protein
LKFSIVIGDRDRQRIGADCGLALGYATPRRRDSETLRIPDKGNAHVIKLDGNSDPTAVVINCALLGSPFGRDLTFKFCDVDPMLLRDLLHDTGQRRIAKDRSVEILDLAYGLSFQAFTFGVQRF